MSSSIEERIVKMGFNNTQFENAAKTSIRTLDSLKKGLNLENAARGLSDLNKAGRSFSLGNIADAVTGLSGRFSALGIVGITAIQNITNSVINMGKKLIDAVAIAPIRTGLQEYETQINAIQTILANTSMKGTTLPQVMEALEELNNYADKTIYNFTEMTRNIGTFTAAGVDLETSVSAIKGIANLAAVSGSNSQQAATAMYQLSQALSSGTVKLMDWNSVVNAGMGGQVFQDSLKETARLHKVNIDAMIKKEGSFRDTLSSGWLTSQILTETLAKFTGDLGEAQLKSLGYTDQQIKKILELGEMANDAATKVKTFTQLTGTIAEAIQSTWTKSWTLIIGDFGEAKSLFTQISDAVGVQVEKMGKSRNDLLEGWRQLGGRDAVIGAMKELWSGLITIVQTFSDVLATVFPPLTSWQLYTLSVNLYLAADAFRKAAEKGERLKRIFLGVLAPFQIFGSLIGAIVRELGKLAEIFLGPIATGFDFSIEGIFNFLAMVGDASVGIKDWLDTNDIFNKGMEKVGQGILFVVGAISQFITNNGPEFTRIWGEITGFVQRAGEEINAFAARAGPEFARVWGEITGWVAKTSDEIKKFVDESIPKIEQAFTNVKTSLEPLKTAFDELITTISPVFEKLKTSLSEAFSKINFAGVGDEVTSFGTKVKEAIGPLDVVIEKVGKVFAWFGRVFEKVAPIFGIVGGAIGQSLSSLGTSIEQAISNIDFNRLGSIIQGGLLAALLLAVRNFIQNGAEAMGGVSELLSGVKDSLEAWQNSLKAKTLVQIAIAIGILALSLLMLSSIDEKKLYTGLTTMTVMFGELVASLKVLEQAKGGGLGTATMQLLLLAGSLMIMSIAVKRLADIDTSKMMQGLVGIGVLLGELAIYMKIGGKGDLGNTAGLLTLAIGLVLLGKAVETFGKLKPEEMGLALKAIAISLTEIAVFGKLTKDQNLVQTAAALTLVSVALMFMAAGLKTLGNLSWEEIGIGLTALGGTLSLMGIALDYIKIEKAFEASLAIAVISGSMILLAGVLKLMGNLSVEEIGKSLVAMGVSLALFALTLNASSGTMQAAAALAILIGSLTMFIPVLILLGSQPWQTIVLGLAALAGVFIVLGLATLILTPLVPVMIFLAGAIFLLSSSALVAGTAMSLFAVGMALMVTVAASGMAVMTLVITKFLELIPSFVAALVNAVVQFAVMMAVATPTLVGSLLTMLTAMVAGLASGVPALIEQALILVISILDTINSKLPDIIEQGMGIIISLIEGLTKAMPELIPVAIDAVLVFLTEVGKKIPDIIKSGFDLIVNFLDGMASAMDTEIPRVMAAVGRLAMGIIDGLVKGITEGLGNVIAAVGGVVNGAIDAAKQLLGIQSPSKVFGSIGKMASVGLGDGMIAMAKYVANSAEEVGQKAVNSISKVTAKISDAIDSNMNMQPVIAPVLDLSNLANGRKDISGMLSGVNISGSLNKLSSIAGGIPTHISGVGVAGETNISFEQNNYSPEALSRLEIYRQTRNQLKLLKGLEVI